MSLRIVVHHRPAPQGSKRRGNRGQLIESAPGLASYRDAVTAATLAAMRRASWPTMTGPLEAWLTFTLPRPAGHYGTGRHAGMVRASAPAWPAVKPDVDKLVRATLDGLADGAALRSDALIVRLTTVKTYPGMIPRALSTPGALIKLGALDESTL